MTMATLILDRSHTELRLDGAAIAIYQNGERQRSVPVRLLDRVVIQCKVDLDSNLIAHLAEQGVGLLMLSRRYSRRIAIVLGPQHNDASVRLVQAQRVSDARWCNHWAWRQVHAKTRSQIALLRRALAVRPDRRKPLLDAMGQLEAIRQRLEQVRSAPDATRLRGSEGAAARIYYQGLAALFPESLGFNGRNRRPPRDPVNACLSLGYTLLHFDAVRAAHSAGLDPLLGFYHRPAFGRESLASDLIEPLRPRIDNWVWDLMRNRGLRKEHFTIDQHACLLGKAGRGIYYAGYEAQAGPARRYLPRQCAILARRFREQGEALIEPIDNEEIDF